jgi:NitT/TauT family transport system substrate-binding protein
VLKWGPMTQRVHHGGRMFCLMGKIGVKFVLLTAVALGAGTAFADDTIRLVAQKTGTFAWELDVIRTHGLDKQAALKIEATELASPEAGKVALRGGSADIIVSDWTWVSRERALGARLVFYPYSSALGAVMVAGASPIGKLGDLRGRKLAVAGGPIDKSWLLLQAALLQDGVDLRTQANVVYGAPVLLAEKTLHGEMDATLNYWNICANLEARGLRRLAEVADLLPKLGVAGRPAMLGYVFNERWAARHEDPLARFLDISSKAKDILAHSDAEWERIAPLVGASDPAALKIYRERYREGIPQRSLDQEQADARTLYGVLAGLGGAALVGPSGQLDAGTFYRARPRS